MFSKRLGSILELASPWPWQFALVQLFVHMRENALSICLFKMEFEEIGAMKQPLEVDFHAFSLSFLLFLVFLENEKRFILAALIHLLLRTVES